MGGKDLSFGVGLKAPFTNNNASEEEKAWGKTPLVGGSADKC